MTLEAEKGVTIFEIYMELKDREERASQGEETTDKILTKALAGQNKEAAKKVFVYWISNVSDSDLLEAIKISDNRFLETSLEAVTSEFETETAKAQKLGLAVLRLQAIRNNNLNP